MGELGSGRRVGNGNAGPTGESVVAGGTSCPENADVPVRPSHHGPFKTLIACETGAQAHRQLLDYDYAVQLCARQIAARGQAHSPDLPHAILCAKS